MKNIFEQNYYWWTQKNGDTLDDKVTENFGFGYTRNDILEENLRASLLVDVNKYIITQDSQDTNLTPVYHVWNF